MVANTDLISTKSVVVFTPPAVEPGEPPMKMISVIIIIVGNAIVFTSKTINPDVRQVIIWKNEVKILSKKLFCPLSAWSFSMRKKIKVQIRMMAKVVVRMILVWGINPFH